MKFNKVANAFMFSKLIREDGKITILAQDRWFPRQSPKRIKGIISTKILKTVFIVYDENNQEIDVLNTLKEAKEKYQ